MSTRPPISEGGEHRADDGLVGRVVDEQEISQRLDRRRRMQVTAIEDMPWNMHEFALTGPAANTSETAEASRRRLPVMVIIAVGGDYLEPSFRVAAARGDGTVRASLLQLEPPRGRRVLPLRRPANQAEAIDPTNDTSRGPLVHAGNGCGYRAGFDEVDRDMLIACAECGCLAEHGEIVTPCDSHPECCCAEVPLQPSE